MAKPARKRRKPTTNEALEMLLGAKAAKRLRKLALQIVDKDERTRRRKKKEKAGAKAKAEA
jgi:hypothetical protein